MYDRVIISNVESCNWTVVNLRFDGSSSAGHVHELISSKFANCIRRKRVVEIGSLARTALYMNKSSIMRQVKKIQMSRPHFRLPLYTSNANLKLRQLCRIVFLELWICGRHSDHDCDLERFRWRFVGCRHNYGSLWVVREEGSNYVHGVQ